MGKINPNWGIATKAIHGYGPSDPLTGAVSVPIFQTSTFEFKNAQHGADLFAGEAEGYIYSRISNPTVDAFEKEIASLEGGEVGKGFASGMAATFNAVMTECKAGDSYISSETMYGGTHAMNVHVMPRFGVTAHEVDATDLNLVEDAIKKAKNCKMLIFETPANPTLSVLDIKALTDLAHQYNLKVMVDNTFATPILQRPLESGADIVMHSATKYISGHGDVVAGCLVSDAEFRARMMEDVFIDTGGCMAPFSAWLLLRGLKTIPVRMRAHCANASRVAKFLAFHPKIESVSYPGLVSHPQHELAKKQMSDFGGMVTFTIAGGFEEGKKMMDAVSLAKVAVSLGDCDTLINHPASTTHSTYSPEDRAAAGIAENLIRISVGIEDIADILDDLNQALRQL
ncbi:MAG TPA: aminotransferase class I/II-fold pyridoxal phosphate-dependent enzyme [Bacteroidetes bacterium]|nr:aminotransferase class I/II-fold pyridoxal phosphate-dependent enzyme [Bacteroidota bacterium]HEX04178.1 aminotransferase class I/II-fold pyridoxal phosphate-dependent enzyme [Bacteroidota bacterium]